MTPSAVDESLDAVDGAEWVECARRGDFASAWRASDRIRSRLTPDRFHTGPRHLQFVWDGTPLAGRRVLIRCYHGLGDTIQFIRYAPLVREIALSVTVWAQPALLPLLDGLRGIDRLIPLHDGLPDVDYDVDVEVMELPYIFRTTIATIPANVPYLRATADCRPTEGVRAGIIWRAGDWNHHRSIPFAHVCALCDDERFSWCGLQLDRRADERHQNLAFLDVVGLSRTASAMLSMDLVISIDSMSAHLAGALGIPVWTLLPYDADWRWMKERDDSPWYPTMRLFRQPRPGDWSLVIEEVRTALAEL